MTRASFYPVSLAQFLTGDETRLIYFKDWIPKAIITYSSSIKIKSYMIYPIFAFLVHLEYLHLFEEACQTSHEKKG